MAYDEALAERVREILAERIDVTERSMFGGTSDDEALRAWVERAVAFTDTLPAK